MSDHQFIVHAGEELIYIHTFSGEVGHTCAAVEPYRFGELVWQLVKVWIKRNLIGLSRK